MTEQIIYLISVPAAAILLVLLGYFTGRRSGLNKGHEAGYKNGHLAGWCERHEDSTTEEQAAWRARHPRQDYIDRAQ